MDGANLLTMGAASARAGVSETTIKRYVERGVLPVASRELRGKRRRVFFTPEAIYDFSIWHKEHQKQVMNRKRSEMASVARRRGVPAESWLRDDAEVQSERNMLLTEANSEKAAIATKALKKLLEKYRLRLPLREQQLGISFDVGQV